MKLVYETSLHNHEKRSQYRADLYFENIEPIKEKKGAVSKRGKQHTKLQKTLNGR